MDLYNNTFDIYTDQDAGGNHYSPSGWYQGCWNMDVDTDWRENPHSGFSCIKVVWNGLGSWNGVMWQEPDSNWIGNNGMGYNLTGATKLTFWVKTDDPGLRLIYIVGYPDDSCGEIKDTTDFLNANWTQYEIDLTGKDISDICGGFAIIFNDPLDPEPDGCTFYLDDIKYDLVRTDSLRILLSYAEYDKTDSSLYPCDKEGVRNAAYTDDNAQSMLAFLDRGNEDDLRRAQIIGDALVYAQLHDADYSDGRLRNAYSSGDIANHETGDTRLPGW